MKKVLFIHSHIGSGYKELMTELDKVPKIQCFEGYAPFRHPEDLSSLTNNKHKLNNVSAIYVHPIIKNYEWVSKKIRETAKNIFLIARPEICFNEISKHYLKDFDYYSFRLKGLYETAKQTENKIFITADNIEPINEYLKIDLSPLSLLESSLTEEKSKAKYEEYLKLFKKLD